jgi:ribose transport system permease protein
MTRRLSAAQAPHLLVHVQFNQERIVFAIAFAMFVGFSVLLHGFLTPGNIISLVQNVSILGVLGIGMALTIIGRGIDLSMIANMVVSVAWLLYLANHGTPLPVAILLGFGLSVAIGILNGVLIAYVEIPAIFATLAMGTAVYGFGQSLLVDSDVIFVPKTEGWFKAIGGASFLHIPTPVLWLITVALIAFAFLRFTRPGRFLFGMGDNPLAARITGVPTRHMMVLQYVLSSLVAFIAGVVTATLVNSMNTRVATSTMVYDVILVVVIGGVGLSGGKGSVRNVLVGTLLVGTLLNGMTIMDIPYTFQNIVKSLILLVAIVTDSLLNPRDEQTSQQGDI